MQWKVSEIYHLGTLGMNLSASKTISWYVPDHAIKTPRWTTLSLITAFRHVQTQHCVWSNRSVTAINDPHSNGAFSSFSVPLTCQHSTVSTSVHIRAGILQTSSLISPVNLAILNLSVFIFNIEQKYLFGLRETVNLLTLNGSWEQDLHMDLNS